MVQNKELTEKQKRELRNVRAISCMGCMGTLLVCFGFLALVVWGLIELIGWIATLF